MLQENVLELERAYAQLSAWKRNKRWEYRRWRILQWCGLVKYYAFHQWHFLFLQWKKPKRVEIPDDCQPEDCWVGDRLFLDVTNDVVEGIDLAELLRLGLSAKLAGQAGRASEVVADYIQERTVEHVWFTLYESIATAILQDRTLFETAGSKTISAALVLRYLDAVIGQNPDASKILEFSD